MNLEIFSCSGGMGEGFRRAGIRFDVVVDRDPDACTSYRVNLDHLPIQMDVRDLVRLARAGWRPGAVDLLVADPPCTPWSRAGKRQGTADERDMLGDTAELIALLRPRAYLIGNVPGLQDSTSWHVVQEVIGGLARHGYCVVDYAQLDAADYGVPQHRIRPFWFGHRRGPCIRWPAPTHGDPAQVAHALPGMGLQPWVTCREALQHLPVEELGRIVRQKWNPKHTPSNPGAPGNVVTANGARHQCNTIAISRHEEPCHTSVPDEPARTLTTKGEHNAAKLEWPWDRPSTTVCTDRRMAPPGHHGKSFLSDNRGHGPNAIALSERAAAILQGFPDGWTFHGATKRARWSQIGQAMPPPLAEAVARAVVEAMRRAKAEVEVERRVAAQGD